MKSVLLTTALVALTTSFAAAGDTGFVETEIDAPHHGRAMQAVIWYPAQPGTDTDVIAQNPVFHGVEVARDAAISAGAHPIVVLSHGMGGNWRSLAWLSHGLSQAGAIVISVNHPNTTWGDFDLAKGMHHWTRVQDLSLALGTVLDDSRFINNIDATRIMAAGFSYGGWSALSMGGVRGDHAGYVAHCETYGAASSHCDSLMSREVQLSKVPADVWDASYADPRITQVVAIEPGLIWGLTDEDIADLPDQVRLIGLGAGADRLLATDFDASGFANLLPEAAIDRIVPGTHFSALPLCTDRGAKILAWEKDDPVCTDPEGTDRKAVHDLIISRMVADLGL